MSARDQLDRQYLAMRERVLSLAADFDRLARMEGGEAVLAGDRRVARLLSAIDAIATSGSDRAERVQLLLSDPAGDPRHA